MYGSLVEFLKSKSDQESIVNYDFKNECPYDYVREESDSIEKFFAYKKAYDTEDRPFDCDNSNGSCNLSGDIYEALWGWRKKHKYTTYEPLNKKINVNWDRYGTDTMNSFKTIYNQISKLNKGNESQTNDMYLLQRFAKLTHSLGNFTLVPFHLSDSDTRSFNQYRGFKAGRYFVYDFFDLSLKIIKEHIGEESFKNYIDVFCLNMYVDENYQIKPLMKRHERYLNQEKMDLSNPNDFLPETMDEAIEFLQNTIRNIETRGYLLASKLLNVEPAPSVLIEKTELQEPQKEEPVVEKPKSMETLWAEYERKKKKRSKNIKIALLIFSFCYTVYYAFREMGLSPKIILSAYKEYGLAETVNSLKMELLNLDFFLNFIGIMLLVFLVPLFIITVVSTIIDIVLKSIFSQCPYCGKLYSYKRTSNKIIKEQSISIKVINKEKDKEGNVRGTTEQYIPGARRVYRSTYECSYCGCGRYSEHSSDVKLV